MVCTAANHIQLKNAIGKWRRSLVARMGGHDPVLVNNLMYHASLLTKCIETILKHRKVSSSYELVTNIQIREIKEIISALDPYYAQLKGYTDGKRCFPRVEKRQRNSEGRVAG